MDRYYNMKPIAVGSVTGFRAELAGVGSGADALRAVFPAAIQRVGVSITPIVAQQLFIEILKGAVAFAEDSGLSVNIADLISFKWSIRGNYETASSTVPKSALQLNSVISPSLTRNINPRFDLVAQPQVPTLTVITNPLDTQSRGVFARGFALSNVSSIRVVNAEVPTEVYVEWNDRGVDFTIGDNGRILIMESNGTLVTVIPEGARGQLQYRMMGDSTWVNIGSVVRLLPRAVEGLVVTSATPQPVNIATDTLHVTLLGGGDTIADVIFKDDNGNDILRTENITYEKTFFNIEPAHFVKVAAWSGGPLNMVLVSDFGTEAGRFYANVNSFSL